MPSGFFLPSAKPGDYPYFVNRLPSWLYPGKDNIFTFNLSFILCFYRYYIFKGCFYFIRQ